jgi:hypothetical protein
VNPPLLASVVCMHDIERMSCYLAECKYLYDHTFLMRHLLSIVVTCGSKLQYSLGLLSNINLAAIMFGSMVNESTQSINNAWADLVVPLDIGKSQLL